MQPVNIINIVGSIAADSAADVIVVSTYKQLEQWWYFMMFRDIM